jgi:hypothetical protein
LAKMRLAVSNVEACSDLTQKDVLYMIYVFGPK